ncbi:predicted protein [Naegleria gruberi]|uniref:Predicted protein n=1 Tax=Naegleria gruberi TaxID=5762 RepID=D2W0A0_NAEGR|nr:uncharacterized protein NAEGRDRAFT_74783 [Naegleria gruberi]EFC37538.1 predicted protein [Naegleria gruberi]|eukprot:XP_002670282.1 predicted protein [Naegleria gruberi strain NEG-M]
MNNLLKSIRSQIHQHFTSSNNNNNTATTSLLGSYMLSRKSCTTKQWNVFVIACDGNIGVGKSTLCKVMQQYIHKEFSSSILLCHIEEDVEKNIELFKKYLSNQREYGLEFQKWIIKDKIQQFLDKVSIWEDENVEQDKIVVIMDRSLLADRFVFFRNLLEKKLMSQEQLQDYEQTFEKMSREYPVNLFYPDFHIILEASIDVAMERINRRNRVGESSVYNKNYLQMIEDFHLDMYKTLPVREGAIVYRHDNSINQSITNIEQFLTESPHNRFV